MKLCGFLFLLLSVVYFAEVQWLGVHLEEGVGDSLNLQHNYRNAFHKFTLARLSPKHLPPAGTVERQSYLGDKILHYRLITQTKVTNAFLGGFILSLATGPGSL